MKEQDRRLTAIYILPAGCRFRRICRLILFILLCCAVPSGYADTRNIKIFTIEADFALDSIEEELTQLDRLTDEICRQLRLPKIEERVLVHIFPDETAWRTFYKQKYPNSRYTRALFLWKDQLLNRSGYRGEVFLCLNDKFLCDMRHECTHAVLSAALHKQIPIWIDEGIAEYFETENAGIQNSAWLNRTQARIAAGKVLPVAQLEKFSGMNNMTAERYCDCWAWVCYLLNGPEEIRQIIPGYLNDLGQRKLFPSPVSRRLVQVTRQNAENGFARFFQSITPSSAENEVPR